MQWQVLNMSSQRNERIQELIKEEVSRIIQFRLQDPRVGMVTVTDAKVSVDLRYAKIYFTVLGDEADQVSCLDGLNHARKYIRGELAGNVQLRYVPEITFEFDNSLNQAMRIEELLAGVQPEPRAPADDVDDESPPDSEERGDG